MSRRYLLTPRQREVLSEAKNGRKTARIAHKLGISPHTVSGYFSEAYRRLGARNRAHAVALAVALGEI